MYNHVPIEQRRSITIWIAVTIYSITDSLYNNIKGRRHLAFFARVDFYLGIYFWRLVYVDPVTNLYIYNDQLIRR